MRHELIRVIYAARPTQAGMINQSGARPGQNFDSLASTFVRAQITC